MLLHFVPCLLPRSRTKKPPFAGIHSREACVLETERSRKAIILLVELLPIVVISIGDKRHRRVLLRFLRKSYVFPNTTRENILTEDEDEEDEEEDERRGWGNTELISSLVVTYTADIDIILVHHHGCNRGDCG